jgi:hypothetical protein
MADISTAMSEPSGSRQDRNGFNNWRDIEPVLKWVAVAYALGFLTVMLYTYNLGVPVLQLIEPVNVWIGAPLAIIAYFLDKLFKFVKSGRDQFRERIKRARRDEGQFVSREDLTALLEQSVRLLASGLAFTFSPSFGLFDKLANILTNLLIDRYLKIPLYPFDRKSEAAPTGAVEPTEAAEPSVQSLQHWIGKVLYLAELCSAAVRLANILVIAVAIPFFCFIYVWYVYPHVPQTLGGGKPTAVQLVMLREDIPQTHAFAGWVPEKIEQTKVISAGAENDSKEAVIVPVTLYFHTEHELYVRNGSGPIAALSEHAVLGIVYGNQQNVSLPK